MCGIAGLIMQPNFKRTEKQMEIIRKLYAEIFAQTDERGGHASGFVVFNETKAPKLFKQDMLATYLVHKAVCNELLEEINEHTTFVIGHTRYATKGDSKNLVNVHPISVLPIVGVHNGSIHNDDDLFKLYGFDRIGQVDSEVIFQMLALYSEPYKLTKDSVQTVFREIKGNVAIAYANIHNPHQLCIVKGNNPMDMVYDPNLGVLWYDSDDTYIYKAYANYMRWTGEDLDVQKLANRNLIKDTGYLINQRKLGDLAPNKLYMTDGIERFDVAPTVKSYGYSGYGAMAWDY